MTEFNDPNPYTSPTAVTTPPAPDRGPLGPARQWTAFEAIEFGWNAIRRAPWIVLLLVVAAIVAAIPDGIGAAIQTVLMLGDREALIVIAVAVRVVLMLVGLGLNAWIALGKSRVKLAVCRGGEAQFGEIFAGGALGSMLGAYLVIGVVIVLGLLVCIGPGLVLLLAENEELAVVALIFGGLVFAIPATVVGWKIQFFPFLIVDRGASAVQSLSMSWRMTDGHVLGLFVYWLAAIALVIVSALLGVLALCVGWIVTIPTALTMLALAQAHIYLKLSGEEPVLRAS